MSGRTVLKWSYGLRIRQNEEVSYYYLTATILRNAHCTLCGNQTSEYFNCYSRCLLEALKMKTENLLREELCYSSDI